MLLDLILSLGVRRRHTPVFLNTPPMLFLRFSRVVLHFFTCFFTGFALRQLSFYTFYILQ